MMFSVVWNTFFSTQFYKTLFLSRLCTRIIFSDFGFRVLNIFGCSNTAIQHLNKRLGVNNRYYSG
jgi:hypothetical protein